MPRQEVGPWLQLIGEKCWHVSAGGAAAPSFLLACGEKVPRQQPLKNTQQPLDYRANKGAIELLVWCSWRLQTSSSVLGTSDQDEAGVEQLNQLIGTKISDVRCYLPARDLCIDFENGRRLVIFCDHAEPEASISQNWELFLPDLYVSVGPGGELEIESSRE